MDRREGMQGLMRELAASRAVAHQPLAALCYAPFAQMHFTPDGEVTVCSKSVHRVLGNVVHDRLVDIWRGPAMESIRGSLRDGVFPPGCDYCESHLHGHNIRNNPLLDFDRAPVAPASEWPRMLSFAFSDLCNLACIHCSPDLSSVLRSRAGLPPRPGVYGESFFDQLAEFLPHVRSISFLGGEPLMQTEVYRVVEMVESAGTDPTVLVTTNGTVWNWRVEQMLDRLSMRVAISLDAATPRTFETIRSGARFDRVFANVRRFRQRLQARGGRLRLNFCLLKANWHEFADFLLLAEDLDADCWVTLVTVPHHLGLFSLGTRALARVVRQLEARSPELAGLRPGAATKWRETLRSLRTAVARGQRTQVLDAMSLTAAALRRGHGQLALLAANHIDREHPDNRAENGPLLPDMDLPHRFAAAGLATLARRAAEHVDPDSAAYGTSLVFRAERHLENDELTAADSLLMLAEHRIERAPDVSLRLAWLRFRQGRYAEGLAYCDRLEGELRPLSAPPDHLALGLLAARANLLRRLGDHGGAISMVGELSRLEPDNPQHVEFLAILRQEAAERSR